MITKQIIHNSQGAAEAEVIALLAKVKHKLKSGTEFYNDVVKHPTLNKWATRYLIPSENDSQDLKDLWALVYDHLNPNQINNLVLVTEDWYSNGE
jgi:hypothetical protein